MLGASPALKLPLGTSTAMEEPTGHPPSVSTTSSLRGAGKHPPPRFTSQKSTEPKGAAQLAAWTRSQPFHPCRCEPGPPTQLLPVLQKEELFFLPPPPTPFFHWHDDPNRANGDPWPALCHDVFFLTVKSRSSGSCITRYLGKERFLSFF